MRRRVGQVVARVRQQRKAVAPPAANRLGEYERERQDDGAGHRLR